MIGYRDSKRVANDRPCCLENFRTSELCWSSTSATSLRPAISLFFHANVSRTSLFVFCVLCSQLLIARKIDLFRSFLLSTVYFDQFNYRFLLFYLDTASCPGMYTWTNYKEFVRLRKKNKVSLYFTALFILRIPLIL